jgi:FlgO protein
MPDLRALAEQVDVDIVLTGTLMRAGDQLRVNAQLVEAPGGAVLWSLTSQVPLGDVFQLQDALAQRIVGSLALPLSARDQRLLKHDVPATAKAYEFYLRANKLGYDPKQWAVTRDLYLQCLEEDPSYAPAWARLGRIYRVLGMYTERNSQELYRQAESAFKRALELNPQLPLAHNLYTYLEVELGGAREAMLRLLERAQGRAGDPELFAGLVQACRYCGLLEDSVAAHNEARRLDPEIRTSVAHSYLMLGDFTRAIETNVEDPPTLNALALQLSGGPREARRPPDIARRRPSGRDGSYAPVESALEAPRSLCAVLPGPPARKNRGDRARARHPGALRGRRVLSLPLPGARSLARPAPGGIEVCGDSPAGREPLPGCCCRFREGRRRSGAERGPSRTPSVLNRTFAHPARRRARWDGRAVSRSRSARRSAGEMPAHSTVSPRTLAAFGGPDVLHPVGPSQRRAQR